MLAGSRKLASSLRSGPLKIQIATSAFVASKISIALARPAITIKRLAKTPFILIHVSVTPKALWYIESHLSSEISLEAVAEAAGVSRFHLSRTFAASTGSSLAGYSRARRLSEAAKALVKGTPDILSVALDAGYSSHEAFTRAFASTSA